MPEKPKPERMETDEKRDRSAWKEDQDERGYYYDDSHGYQDYVDQVEGDDEGCDRPADAQTEEASNDDPSLDSSNGLAARSHLSVRRSLISLLPR